MKILGSLFSPSTSVSWGSNSGLPDSVASTCLGESSCSLLAPLWKEVLRSFIKTEAPGLDILSDCAQRRNIYIFCYWPESRHYFYKTNDPQDSGALIREGNGFLLPWKCSFINKQWMYNAEKGTTGMRFSSGNCVSSVGFCSEGARLPFS